MSHLLIFLVLTSAAACTQTTILPTARTTLSMATYKAIPKVFAKVHPRYLTPTVSTIAFGGVSIALYCGLNYTSSAINVIADAVSALGMMIAFYYGLTGFACFWYYRKNLTSSPRNFIFQGLMPLLGGLILLGVLGWSLKRRLGVQRCHHELHELAHAVRAALAHRRRVPDRHRHLPRSASILMFVWRAISPAFFRGETLRYDTPTLVPDRGRVRSGVETQPEPVERAQPRPAPALPLRRPSPGPGG